MKLVSPVLLVVAAALFLLAPAGVFAGRAAAEEAPAPAATSQQPDKLRATLDAIRQAPEPSAAVDAYAKGSAVAPDDPALQEAFVRRMVEFGLPLMAETQARTLVQHDQKNGLAWGVLAYALGARGETSDALIDIGRAVQCSSDVPFVQRTAGQLLAWCDILADQTKLPEAAKKAAADVSHKLADQPAYADAYQQARAAYEQQSEIESLGEAAVAPPLEEYPQVVPPVYNSYTYNYEAPSDVFPPEPYSQYLPYLAYPGFIGGYYDGYSWPSTSSVIVVPQRRDRGIYDHGIIIHREPERRDFLRFPSYRRPGSFVGHEGRPRVIAPHREHNAWNWRGSPGSRIGRVEPQRPAFAPHGRRGSQQRIFSAPSSHRSLRSPGFAPRVGRSSGHFGRGGRR